MAHESFEDQEIAELLNRYFVSIKVDKEERPDIDSVYMAVCQAFTGSGGWPTSILMTADQKPFFAGTYFPKTGRRGFPGLKELLLAVHDQWDTGREALLQSAEELTALLNREEPAASSSDNQLLDNAMAYFRQSFDAAFGGFGNAPKFPTPHNLLFLLQQYEKHGDSEALHMAEVTLRQLYRGGIFDHIGYGFSRYATDRAYLVPHFEKMLYDNALLIPAYCRAYALTGRDLYREVAEKTMAYIRRELSSPDGGYYSAQDADSDGEEGRYYVFTPAEIEEALGEKAGAAFCETYDITQAGNFHGKSIPNLLHTETLMPQLDNLLPALQDYRSRRASLHRDDKQLAFWNALMIAALCSLYRVTGKEAYLTEAKQTQAFIEQALCDGVQLYVSCRAGRRSGPGYLDDYAGYAHALQALYDATLDPRYLTRAKQMVQKAVEDCFDASLGGFYLYGSGQEALVLRPKPCYDGALPSGNALMAAVLVRLQALSPEPDWEHVLEMQLAFLAAQAADYPAGHTQFLMALSDVLEPPLLLTVVGPDERAAKLPLVLRESSLVRVLAAETEAYPRINDATTFYACLGHRCLPPTNKLSSVLADTASRVR